MSEKKEKVPKIKEEWIESDGEKYTWEDEEPIVSALTCGWTEDGRCGYGNTKSYMQTCVRPIRGLAKEPNQASGHLFVCKQAAAGSRHTAFIMVNSRKERGQGSKKTKKIGIIGLNQQGLCEEPGYTHMTDLPWDLTERPVQIAAGAGTTFILTKFGNIYSCGIGKFGVLGHGDDISVAAPRQIMTLLKQRIKGVAAGHSHAIAMTYSGRIFTWGRNHKGQLGLGFASHHDKNNPEHRRRPAPSTNGLELDVRRNENQEYYNPEHLTSFGPQETCLGVAAGQFHTMALMQIVAKNLVTKQVVYVWGDHSRGQLGSAEPLYHARPQENRWLSQLATKLQSSTYAGIAAGGNTCLALTGGAGQVISWGAGDYGQLGHGFAWDDPRPRLIQNLKDIKQISCGMRHCMALRNGNPSEVFSWGYNGYGELGLGDCNIRLQPTIITGLGRARPVQVSCGDRHSVIVTSHKPMLACEEPDLKAYFGVLEESGVSFALKKQLKFDMRSKGLDPDLLDDANAIIPGQPGATDAEILTERYEKGLRYCLDTQCDPADWRRKTYETCYKAPGLGLKSVCLSCARHCLFDQNLVPFIRLRLTEKKKKKKRVLTDDDDDLDHDTGHTEQIILTGNACDCVMSGRCVCSWSPIRAVFDKIANPTDQSIMPNQVRPLLQLLRAPAPVDNADVEEALMTLAEGVEDATSPKILPVPFELWYREFYQEVGDDRAQLLKQIHDAQMLKKRT